MHFRRWNNDSSLFLSRCVRILSFEKSSFSRPRIPSRNFFSFVPLYRPWFHIRNFSSFYYLVGTWPIYHVLISIWLFIVAFSFIQLHKAYKKENGLQRRQMVYFSSSMFIGFSGGTTNFLPLFGIDWYPYGNFAIPIYSAIASYAILTHRLLDINVAIQKSTVYSVLITIITLVYLVLIWFFERVFQLTFGYQSIFVNILTLSIIAVIFQPLKNNIQNTVDNFFFKGTAESLAREKERLERELQRTERLRTVGILASGMAHEIKNPLVSIKTFANYLPERANDPEFLKKFREVVGSEVEKIDRIIKDLLDFSRPKPPEMKPVEITTVLSHCIDLLENELSKKVIKAALQGTKTSTKVTGDRMQLEQAIINVLINSIEFMALRGRLEISLSEENGYAKLKIQDNGKGISKEDLPHIFDPFFTKKEEGTGLGLAITHRIIEEHKGRISVESELGKGTTFTIELPLSPPSGLPSPQP